MPITPISSVTFKHKRFKRHDSYIFASKDALAPLVLGELIRASVALPIGFARFQNTLMPVAIQGFGNQKNLFVAPDRSWVGRYVPSAYRGYPFSLANDAQGRNILCFDDSSGLLTDDNGEPFFSDDGKPSDRINGVLNFLTQVAFNKQVTEKACALLDQQDLLEPWPIMINALPEEIKEENTRQLDGILRVNEATFRQLGQNELYALHQAGTLTAIYCHLLSMQHLPDLVKLAEAHRLAEQKAALPKNEAGELDLSFLADDTTISFEDFQDL